MKLHLGSVLCICSVSLGPANSTPNPPGPKKVTTHSFGPISVKFMSSAYPSQSYDGYSEYPVEESFAGWSHNSPQYEVIRQIFPPSFYSRDYYTQHSYPHHHYSGYDGWGWKGWGWGWEKPKKKQPKPQPKCEPVRNREIRTPADLDPNWRIMKIYPNSTRETIRAELILDPPREPIPSPFPSISAGQPSPFKSEFQQSIKRNLIDSSVDIQNVTLNEDTNVSTPAAMELPQPSNEIEGPLTIYRLPTLSAPLRGKYDPRMSFEKGLNNSISARSRKQTSSPVQNFMDNDLKFMGNLFQQLKNMGIPPEDTQSEESLVEMPQVISRVERRNIPEPDHSERTVLDFEFNFGLPVVSVQFESPLEIMKEVERRKTRRFVTADMKFLVTPQMFRDFVGDKIRRDLSRQRRIGRGVFVAADGRVQGTYSINQYIICTTANCDDCGIDPIFAGSQYADFRNGRPSGRGRRPSPTPKCTLINKFNKN